MDIFPTSIIFVQPSGGDDTDAINNAIAEVSAIGGGEVILSPGVFLISGEITISTRGVTLRGTAGDTWHDNGLIDQPTTLLKWIGESYAVGIHVLTPNDTTKPIVCACSVRDLVIDGAGLLQTGLQVTSIRNGNFENILIKECTQQSFFITNYNREGWGEATDTQRCYFRRLMWRNYDSPNVHNAKGIVLSSQSPGTANANVSINKFEFCNGITVNGDGWSLGDCDNNTFHSCGAFVTGSGNSLTIAGGYSNYFFGWSAHAPVHIAGMVSGAWQNSIGNVFFDVDQANGTPQPIVDVGCSVQWHGSVSGFYNFQCQGAAPVTSSASGLPGTIVWDTNYIYVCISSGSWKRAALSAF